MVGGRFAVPAVVADRYLKFCTEGQPKVLLLALRQGQSPVDTTGIAARLGLSEAEVNDCLQYWQEAGLFAPCTAPSAPQPAVPQSSQAAPPAVPFPAVTQETANGQTITTVRARGHLSPAEINTLLRQDKQFSALTAELESARGEVLSASEREVLAYLYGSLELSPDYLLVTAAYCRNKGKTKLGYLEKTVAGWLKEGVDTYEKAERKRLCG